MKRIMQINITYGKGSTGEIALSMHEKAINENFVSCYLYSVHSSDRTPKSLTIENPIQYYLRRFLNRFFGRKVKHSNPGTNRLIRFIKKYKPDLIHIHNIHQNSLNFVKFFGFLKKTSIPIIYTLHDCWAFTGGCFHYLKNHCYGFADNCAPCLEDYKCDDCTFKSASLLEYKKSVIGGNGNIRCVCVSKWLLESANLSYLRCMKHAPILIYNGIDTDVYYRRHTNILRKKFFNDNNVFIILGVASYWTKDKGIDYFLDLSSFLPEHFKIVLVGDFFDDRYFSDRIAYYGSVYDKNEMAEIYSDADVFVNPSSFESFGLTTVEAMSCGTPVIAFKNSASPELITDETGIICSNDLQSLLSSIKEVHSKTKEFYSLKCMERVLMNFSKKQMVNNYWSLYRKVLLSE